MNPKTYLAVVKIWKQEMRNYSKYRVRVSIKIDEIRKQKK